MRTANYDSFTIHRSKRSIVAITLALLYLMISLSPLASLAMHSKTVAHAITGECSGDCTTCGCPAESSSTRSCCCSRKQQQQARVHEDEHDATPDCCKKAPAKKRIMIASCGSPCGGGKQIAISTSGTSELLPYHFPERFTLPYTGTSFTNPTDRLTSRHDDPPDPPPKLSIRL